MGERAGGAVLEVAIGTGANLEYGDDVRLTGIDWSVGMLVGEASQRMGPRSTCAARAGRAVLAQLWREIQILELREELMTQAAQIAVPYRLRGHPDRRRRTRCRLRRSTPGSTGTPAWGWRPREAKESRSGTQPRERGDGSWWHESGPRIGSRCVTGTERVDVSERLARWEIYGWCWPEVAFHC